ncbi:MAG: AbrB/MazE/SpoVT family DNA-binding domain-containing protein [Chloroflexi bacterium]|nr:AbrB/MazE/SpoVT family DNA-binding domain-containing protein [Chloroflexota bacterium]
MVTIKVGPDGRVLVPVSLRRELNLDPGTPLVATVEGTRLILERRDAMIDRAKMRFAHVRHGSGAVDELIDERRREARREGSAG